MWRNWETPWRISIRIEAKNRTATFRIRSTRPGHAASNGCGWNDEEIKKWLTMKFTSGPAEVMQNHSGGQETRFIRLTSHRSVECTGSRKQWIRGGAAPAGTGTLPCDPSNCPLTARDLCIPSSRYFNIRNSIYKTSATNVYECPGFDSRGRVSLENCTCFLCFSFLFLT